MRKNAAKIFEESKEKNPLFLQRIIKESSKMRRVQKNYNFFKDHSRIVNEITDIKVFKDIKEKPAIFEDFQDVSTWVASEWKSKNSHVSLDNND